MVRPGKAVVRYTVPMADDSPMPEVHSEEVGARRLGHVCCGWYPVACAVDSVRIGNIKLRAHTFAN